MRGCILDVMVSDEPPSQAPDEALLAALTKAIDAVAYHLDGVDEPAADLMGGVVRVLLRARGADVLRGDVRCRRQLARWALLEPRLGTVVPWMHGAVGGLARAYLIEAARAVGEEQ